MNNIDSYFKNLSNKKEIPDALVWKNLSIYLSKQNRKKGVFYFNKAQLSVLLLGLSLSIVVSLYLFSTINKSNSNEDNIAIIYSKPSNNELTFENSTNELGQMIIEKPILDDTKYINSQNQDNKKLEKLKQKLKEVDQLIKQNIDIDKELVKINEEIELELNQMNLDNQIDNLYLSIKKTKLLDIKPLNIASVKFSDSINNKFSPYLYITPTVSTNISFINFNDKNNSNYFGNNVQFSNKIGYSIGSNYGLQFSKKWSVESGVYYSQYLQSFKGNQNSFINDGIVYIDQFEFPLLARYSFYLNDKNTNILSLKGGLNYGSVQKYQLNYIQYGANKTVDYKYDLNKELYNSIQLGYLLGVGFETKLEDKINFYSSLTANYFSQINKFPLLFKNDNHPKQLSYSLSVGLKLKF